MPAPPAAEGVRLGPFALARRLGDGPSAPVYLAQDVRNGAWVALKVLALDGDREDQDAASASERFVREALAVGQLRHPGLVEVLGAGRDGDRAWVAMEPVPGVNLERYTQPARLLPPQVVASLGRRVADALAHAHAQRVVHRDVKPANIVVDWAHDSVKLVDFGVARWADQARTRSGKLIGSPEYMAPELLAGNDAGPAADWYALGVTLYELLAARRPHGAPTLGALLRAVSRDPAAELSTLRPELPAALCEAVMGLLVKSPGHRLAAGRRLPEALASSAANATGAAETSRP